MIETLFGSPKYLCKMLPVLENLMKMLPENLTQNLYLSRQIKSLMVSKILVKQECYYL